jgi:hypothetical protein
LTTSDLGVWFTLSTLGRAAEDQSASQGDDAEYAESWERGRLRR